MGEMGILTIQPLMSQQNWDGCLSLTVSRLDFAKYFGMRSPPNRGTLITLFVCLFVFPKNVCIAQRFVAL